MLADITISTEAAVAITALLSAVAGAATWAVKGWIATLTEDRNSWKNIALASTSDLEVIANRARKAQGLPPVHRADAVIPESNSPPSAQQMRTAGIATVRQLQAELRDELDLPPRKEGVIERMTEDMKAKVDTATDQIKDAVNDSAEEIKGQIDEIQ